jgi:hypothetical protein
MALGCRLSAIRYALLENCECADGERGCKVLALGCTLSDMSYAENCQCADGERGLRL